MSIQIFSTEGITNNDGARLFEKEMVSRFSVGLSLASGEAEPLHTEMMAYCGRQLQFASLRFSPHVTSASAASIGKGKRWLVTLQKEGEAIVTQEGRTARIGPGDMFLLDLHRPFFIETGSIVTHSIYLDANALRCAVPDAGRMTALRIDTSEGPGAIFRAMSDEIFKLAPVLSESTAGRIADTLPYSLGIALSGCADGIPASPTSLQLFHRERIRAYVRENLHDPALDVERIAQAIRLSSRYIYQLFSDEQMSLMKWVWAQRLEACRQDLVAKSLANRPIGEIAYSWGFSDVAHFSRAFKERFDMTPRAYRKMHFSGAAKHVPKNSHAIEQQRRPLTNG